MINIVVSSKPVDGLFITVMNTVSLNDAKIDARVVVITHRNFTKEDYLKESITNTFATTLCLKT